MNGEVVAQHALLNVTFRPPGRSDLEIECVIDTGFAGYLTLPLAAALAMNLPFIRRMPANLADNSTIWVEVYAAAIVWNGEEREAEILATGLRPLVGTLLLDGSELNIQFAESGLVSVETL
jgi:clan AA aspartic protease